MENTERLRLINKINEWKSKSENKNDDPFDRYISVFIAYNIFYNLLAKTIDPKTNLISGDSKRATSTDNLLRLEEKSQLVKQLSPLLDEYLLSIPVYDEEYWKNNKSLPISMNLKAAYSKRDYNETVSWLLKWLYCVRCDLVYGEKNYSDKPQQELLQKSTELLHIILSSLLGAYDAKHQ